VKGKKNDLPQIEEKRQDFQEDNQLRQGGVWYHRAASGNPRENQKGGQFVLFSSGEGSHRVESKEKKIISLYITEGKTKRYKRENNMQ